MAQVQARLDNDITAFILAGLDKSLMKEDETILTDAGRVIDLEPYTVMAKVAATGKWVPFTDETAVDGTAIPQGMYVGQTIPAADIVAGDVLHSPILVGQAIVNIVKVIVENAKTLDTVITEGVILMTVSDFLENKGLFTESTTSISFFENA